MNIIEWIESHGFKARWGRNSTIIVTDDKEYIIKANLKDIREWLGY